MKSMKMSSLLLILSLATLALSKEYLIAVHNKSSCGNTSTTCLTLDQLALTDLTSGVNLTLIFQPGEHTLTQLLRIQGFRHLHIIGQNRSEISLQLRSSIELSDIPELSIEGVTFIGHTRSFNINNTDNLLISGCHFTGVNALSVRNSMNVLIENAVFGGNFGTALNIIDVGIVSIESSTFTGNQGERGGAVYLHSDYSTFTINNSVFTDNHVRPTFYGQGGGAIYIEVEDDDAYTDFTVSHTQFINNSATKNGANAPTAGGGGIYVSSISGIGSVNATISYTQFINNSADFSGGIGITTLFSLVTISRTEFISNAAFEAGGMLVASITSIVAISHSQFINNSADYFLGGFGVLSIPAGSVILSNTQFIDNSARFVGGIFVSSINTSISHSNLTGNSAIISGSALYATDFRSLQMVGTRITNNTGGARFIDLQNVDNVTFWGENIISGNNGSLYASDCMILFNYGQTTIERGISGSGAIHAIRSQIFFNTAVAISKNTAIENGGGLFLQESRLYVNSPVIISNNTAENDGGAIYAYQSTIEFINAHCTLARNSANNGGGIFAIASNIRIMESHINIDSNIAKANGGGFYMQQNSRLYIVDVQNIFQDFNNTLRIFNNHAQLGGGIYVDDSTASGGACKFGADETVSSFLGECFIQTISLFNILITLPLLGFTTFITHNTVDQQGSAIYGGLLDRCTVNSAAEVANASSGLEYIKRTVKLPEVTQSISSDPLQVRLCDGSPHSSVYTRKGHSFLLTLKAIDQVGNPVNATIRTNIVTKNGVGRLKEGQVEQQVGSECTELEYNVFSGDSSAQLELHAVGPCNNLGLSKLTVNIEFRDCDCPLGFHPSSQSSIECICECDEELQAIECFPEEETFLLNSTIWVGAANFSDCNETGYVVHNCPFDYCVDKPVNISLNSSQQIDRQCAYNRSGVLCGKCEEGLSLLFASSKCKECSNTYLLLLIPFAMSGIALVAYILWLNFTIANGTLYGLIVYANVLAANQAIFLPFSDPNFLTIFVSWVNLDLGIETCFYDGMNSQAKVLLQLAFRTYLFLLIFLIIIVSKYVNTFAKLLSNRNPIAALCTLLILSYSKLLRLIIAALQFTSLFYSDNSFYKTVWLFDGNIQYFSINHIARFVAAAVILMGCVLFTTLLFFGQWFPRCSKWKVMKWTKNVKYIGFMDAFHAPFTPKHRYWPGLLLFSLIAHNLAASMAPGTSIPVLSAGSITVFLNVYRSVMNRVYKDRLNNAFETLFLINVSFFALGTYHFMIRNDVEGQLVLANISMAIAFVLFVVITCYHLYEYVLKKTKIWNKKLKNTDLLNKKQARHLKQAKVYLKHWKPRRKSADIELPPVVDTYGQGPREEADPDKYITPRIIRPATRPDQLREPDLDILAPITTEDYRQVPPSTDTENRSKPVVTCTVVEID